MKSGFVAVPNSLAEDSTVPPDQLAIWILIRRSNTERGKRGVLRGCFRSLETLGGRLSGEVPKHAAGRLKRAVQGLHERGLLAVRRRERGLTAMRWAILPGEEGDGELAALFEAHEIDDAEYQKVQERRRTHSGPSSSADRPPGDRRADPQGSASNKEIKRVRNVGQKSNRSTCSGPSADYDPESHVKMRHEIAAAIREESTHHDVENAPQEGA